MLYDPKAHERVADEQWDAERIRAGIRAIAEDAEATFDDGWRGHPLDEVDDRMRAVYLGGAGVVDALRRLSERGLVDVKGDYVPYLERSLRRRSASTTPAPPR